jgi:hypothetical protein
MKRESLLDEDEEERKKSFFAFCFPIIVFGLIGLLIAGFVLSTILRANYDSPQQQALRNFNTSITVGSSGPSGPPGGGGVLGFAHFYSVVSAVAPGLNVPQNDPVPFDQDGSASLTNQPTRVNGTHFMLPAVGIYEVTFQVSITEAAQLAIRFNGGPFLPYSVAGRATGSSQVSNTIFITTTLVNQILEVYNVGLSAIHVTGNPGSGGNNPVSASLTIVRLQ